MGKLWGRQQKFDKNGDGRLGSGEWRNWYLSTFGHDMEMAERKKVSQMEANWENRLACFCRQTQKNLHGRRSSTR